MMNGMHFVASIVSKSIMAPAMILSGVRNSWRPKITALLHSNGSLPRYIVLTRNIMTAEKGSESVVGKGVGHKVAANKKARGRRQNITSMAFPQGPPPPY